MGLRPTKGMKHPLSSALDGSFALSFVIPPAPLCPAMPRLPRRAVGPAVGRAVGPERRDLQFRGPFLEMFFDNRSSSFRRFRA